MDKIAVLIPCYNESRTIEKVVSDFRRALPEAVIYVYDNNSSDGTDEIARKAGAVVRYERQQGKGNVIRRMFREINADCYIMTDGDDTYPAESAPEMARMVLEEQADMVVGDRLSSTYFSSVKDIMTGYRAFSYQFVKSFPVLSEGFEIETEMSIHAVDKNMLIDHVVVDYRDRPAGSHSKLNTYSDGIKVLRMILRLFRVYRPLAFFGLLSLFLALTAGIFFIPVFLEYLRTGLVARFPTLIVCGFVMLTAIQSFFTGLMLQNAVQKNRRDFEMTLIEIERTRPE